ncbi:MAG TPA: hypothetical protein VF898_02345 [Chloroflexota bacterium]
MKQILQAAASVAASTAASILATWLLRRIVYASESIKGEQSDKVPASVLVIMPMNIMIGNTMGTHVFPGRRSGALAMLKQARGH